MHDPSDPERQAPRPPRNQLRPHAADPDRDPTAGTWILSRELGIAGAVKGYYEPNSFLRDEHEPEELPVDSYCVELEGGDVALWPGDWVVMTPHEQLVLAGAVAGLGALFKNVLVRAKGMTTIKPHKALELLAVAIKMHLRVTTATIEKARFATTQGLIGAKANGERSTPKGG